MMPYLNILWLCMFIFKDRDKGNVRMITFSILKAVEDSNKMIVVYPIDELNDELEGMIVFNYRKM